ncbi:MFS transporter [Bradyrhizobium sp. 150]|uniref:MFS transporter n=1 Tax=Bradyrhizobium sp. 150 TaxID=2782625 RepID=UPI001FFBAF6F|nr:MFS transporter [Bradyrhizobium sp. 150]
MAIGSWGWCRLTDAAGIELALLVSAALMVLSPLLGLWLPMPRISARAQLLDDLEVRLPLTGCSRPLVVEIEYCVAPESARAFRNVMQDVQLSRQLNGAYGWSIARDTADTELWTERYHCPTWLDYLRLAQPLDTIGASHGPAGGSFPRRSCRPLTKLTSTWPISISGKQARRGRTAKSLAVRASGARQLTNAG